MKNTRLPFLATLAISLTLAGSALADTYNTTPDAYWFESTSDSHWYMGSSSNRWDFGNASGGTPAELDTYVDGSGSVSWNGAALNFTAQGVGSTGYSVTLLTSNVTGTVDFYSGGTSPPFNFTFTAQLSITGNGIVGACTTNSFTVAVNVTGSAGSWVPAGALYDDTTGNFRAVNASFNPPTVKTTQCGNSTIRSQVNSTLNLGAGATHHEIVWYGKALDETSGNPGAGAP